MEGDRRPGVELACDRAHDFADFLARVRGADDEDWRLSGLARSCSYDRCCRTYGVPKLSGGTGGQCAGELVVLEDCEY